LDAKDPNTIFQQNLGGKLGLVGVATNSPRTAKKL